MAQQKICLRLRKIMLTSLWIALKDLVKRLPIGSVTFTGKDASNKFNGGVIKDIHGYLFWRLSCFAIALRMLPRM